MILCMCMNLSGDVVAIFSVVGVTAVPSSY